MSEIEYKICEHCNGTGKLPESMQVNAPLHKARICAACSGTGRRPVKK